MLAALASRLLQHDYERMHEATREGRTIAAQRPADIPTPLRGAAAAQPVTLGGSASGHGMAILGLAFAGGLALGWQRELPHIGLLLGIAAGLLTVAAIIARSRRMLSLIALSLGIATFGAGWIVMVHDRVRSDDLAALIGDESVLVRLDGVVTRSPEVRARVAGSMARFDYREPATYFPMRVEAIVPRDGSPIPVRGRVLVRVDQTMAPFAAGDRVRVLGFLLRPAMPRNPGEFDFRQYAKSLGQAGILTVGSRDLVEVFPADRGHLAGMFLAWREDLRRRAGAWLLANLPEGERGRRDALLVSLLLGQRDAEIDQMYESFQRVGLAHILAISGFHLAVLAGFVLLLCRLFGGFRRWHAALIIGAVVLYLLLVEVRMPVMRAGIMTIAGCLGLAFGRRLRAGGLVALSAVALLVWRPDELFNPGFQLTFGVVLALIYLAPALRRRLFGPVDHEAATSGRMVGQGFYTTLAVTITAWLVATPIAAYHFGTVAIVGIPLSVIAVPLSAVILALGYVKIVLSAILPSAALLLGVPLTIFADVLLAMVEAVDELPWSSVHVPHPSTAWTLAALMWACWWCAGRRFQSRRVIRIKRACLALLLVWLLWPALWFARLADRDTLVRIDMLAVGDGSCFLIRSDRQAMLFDAGSSTDLNAGDRSIVPALRRLGVRRLDAVAVSHANLDHYSAVIEMADAFDVREVWLTPQFLHAAERDPLSPMAYMLSRLTSRGIRLVETSAGARRSLGHCAFDWLHPPDQTAFARANDASMVLRLTAGARRVLLCGDIQSRAMSLLMTPDADLRADVLELPHHGSHHDMAEAFVRRVQPMVVMQSTGWSRWQRDRWADALASADRLVTVRDGASVVTIRHDGSIRVSRFLPAGVQAGGAELE